MKQLRFTLMMIIACLSFACISCSSNEESLSATTEKQKLSVKEAEKYLKLTNYMEQINPLYNVTNEEVLTRGSWFRWFAVLKMDAMGYTWGRQHGLTWQLSLVCAAVASITAAILSSKASTFNNWNINPNWFIYTSTHEYEKMGYEHNRLVQQVVSKYPSIRTGNVSVSTILSNTESSLSNIGYSGNIPNLYKTELLAILNSNNLDTFEAKMERAVLNNQSDFLESYAQYISQITDKSMVHSYTQNIIAQIDNLSISDKDNLKAMVCICEHSRFLWTGLE